MSEKIRRIGDPVLPKGWEPKIVDAGKAPIKFAIDWERKVLMMGLVVKDEMGFHSGGFDLTAEDAYALGDLMIKMALDLRDGGGNPEELDTRPELTSDR